MKRLVPLPARLPTIPVLLLSTLLAALGCGYAQVGPVWTQGTEDPRFSGSPAVVEVAAAQGSEAVVGMIGCDAAAPSYPRVVLRLDRRIEAGERELYVRIVGLRETSTHQAVAEGSELSLDGFDAVSLLAEALAMPSARAMFIRTDGSDGPALSVPLSGLKELLGMLPCTASLL